METKIADQTTADAPAPTPAARLVVSARTAATTDATRSLRASAPGGSTVPPARTMPRDFQIAIEPGTGLPKRGPVDGVRRQPMHGYEERYVDIVDYCVRVTDQIWRYQDVGYIYDTYAEACRVHDDSGWKYGVERVVENTMQAINAFPDLKIYADDVIWAGDEDQGFVTSHRAVDVGHQTGPWRWGAPTGRPVKLWVVANCVSRENKFYEEWVLYNTAAQLAQLGVSIPDAARQLAAEGLAGVVNDHHAGEIERILMGRIPQRYDWDPAQPFDVEESIRALFHDTYNRRDLSAIDRLYDPNVTWHGATNREGRGRDVVRSMARNLMSTFPDLALRVDEVYWMGNDEEGYSASVRWSAAGTHRGYGIYGEPTGRRAFLWGISQLYFQHGRIVEDWMLFNELDVVAQLLGPAPSTALL